MIIYDLNVVLIVICITTKVMQMNGVRYRFKSYNTIMQYNFIYSNNLEMHYYFKKKTTKT